MSSTTKPKPPSERKIPQLIAGDHLDQKTFHERYVAMPENVKAELVEGIVYMAASALSAAHGFQHSDLHGWLWMYKVATVGVAVADNATTILGEYSEPQPDSSLMVLREYGGQAYINSKGFFEGAPELTAEVALSSESYDMHAKLRDYERAGVKEYLVVLLNQKRIAWHVRDSSKPGFVQLKPDAEGILKSKFFGGLWLDPAALMRGDANTFIKVLQSGLASPEHAAFVKSLTRRKK